jgi:predicted PurR-regulated permease PerM
MSGESTPTPRQLRILWLALTGLAVAVLVLLAVAFVWGMGHVIRIFSPVLWPLAVAGVLAYLLDPVVDYIEKKGASRVRAILCVFLLALMILVALLGSVVPQIIVESRQLISQIPSLVAKAERRASHWIENPPALIKRFFLPPQNETHAGHSETALSSTNTHAGEAVTNITVSATGTNITVSAAGTNVVVATGTNAPVGFPGQIDNQTIQTATSWIASQLPKAGQWIFGQVGRVVSFFGFFVGLSLVPVYVFYFLLEKEGISTRWTNYLPVKDSRFKEELVFIIDSINGYLIAFFRGQVLVAIIDGILYGIGFIIIGLPYAVLIGVMAMFLTIIPYIGAIITFAVSLVIAVVQYGDWLHPLLVVAVFAVVQTFESLFISPKILGDRVGLHPVTIIIALMVGTTLLGGMLGGILAIPLTAALRVLMFRYVWKKPGKQAKA